MAPSIEAGLGGPGIPRRALARSSPARKWVLRAHSWRPPAPRCPPWRYGPAAVPGASFPSANRLQPRPVPRQVVRHPVAQHQVGPAPNGPPPAATNAPAASRQRPRRCSSSGPIGFKGPVLISHIEPSYPALARQQHAEGDVLVRVIVGKNGIPSQMKVVRGDVRLKAVWALECDSSQWSATSLRCSTASRRSREARSYRCRSA